MRKYAPLFILFSCERFDAQVCGIFVCGGAKMDRTGEWMSEEGESSSPAVI